MWELMGVLAFRAQKRVRPMACAVGKTEDSEPLLLFEELVSLPRWDRCKLMGVLALRAQKRDRPTACPASVYARRDSNPCSSSRSLSVCADGIAANSWRFSPPKRRAAPGDSAPGAALRPGGLEPPTPGS